LKLSANERLLTVGLRTSPAQIAVVDTNTFAYDLVSLSPSGGPTTIAGHQWTSPSGRYTFAAFERRVEPRRRGHRSRGRQPAGSDAPVSRQTARYQAAPRSPSSRRRQSAIRFQLVKIRLAGITTRPLVTTPPLTFLSWHPAAPIISHGWTVDRHGPVSRCAYECCRCENEIAARELCVENGRTDCNVPRPPGAIRVRICGAVANASFTA
jgi:hypothetical protein